MEPFRLERYFAAHEFAVRVHLCASDCEALTVAELLAMEPGEEELRELSLGYTESSGHPELRRTADRQDGSPLPHRLVAAVSGETEARSLQTL